MVAVIFIGFLFVIVSSAIWIAIWSDYESGPSSKLKRINRELLKENEMLLAATKDWRRENSMLKAENFALRNDLPFPVIEEDGSKEDMWVERIKE